MNSYLKITLCLFIILMSSIITTAQLSADRTYYVSTSGSDDNDGLCSGSSFLTIQKAVDVASLQDKNQYAITIQLANGVYPHGAVLRNYSGYNNITIQGNTNTPDSVLISVSTNYELGFYSEARGVKWILKSMKIQATGELGDGVFAEGGYIELQNVNFGACTNSHIRVERNGRIRVTGNYTISGGGLRHVMYRYGGTIDIQQLTITLVGTPAFYEFIYCQAAFGAFYGLSFSGSATGYRYTVDLNGVISTFGGGSNYFPGSSAGTTATGGQYN